MQGALSRQSTKPGQGRRATFAPRMSEGALPANSAVKPLGAPRIGAAGRAQAACLEPLPPAGRSPCDSKKEASMRGILAWVIGIPIPIIILLYLFDVF